MIKWLEGMQAAGYLRSLGSFLRKAYYTEGREYNNLAILCNASCMQIDAYQYSMASCSCK